MMEKDQVLPIGTLLDSGIRQYRIVEVLGHGGFGITYKATGQVKVGNIVMTVPFAIKEHFVDQFNMRQGTSVTTPNASNAKEVSRSLDAFIAEAERLNKLGLEHPGIVKVNEYFRANGTAYYVMEFVEGESLRHFVSHHDGKRLSGSEALPIIRQVGESLSYLHSHEITHLDVKPDNILLGKDGTPVLIDFGLAKHYDSDGKATSTIKVLGTSDGYSPLEQYQGIDHFSPEADVYALAATLLFMFTGKDPVKAAAIRASSIQSELVGKADDEVTAAIVHAMKMLPEERTPSITSFLSEMGENLPEEPKHEEPGSGTIIIVPKPDKPEKKLLMIGSALLGLALVILALVFLHNQSSKGEDERSDVAVLSSDSSATTNIDNGHEWVDLGLSVCWATTNVGAKAPGDCGGYFAWGETTTKNDYSWSSYQWCNGSYDSMTKYCTNYKYGKVDNKKVLDSSNDLAHVSWGGNWRMPTDDELQELKGECKWKWSKQDGCQGYMVTGPNGNTIFLPAAGYHTNSSLDNTGSRGYYWSRTLYENGPSHARGLLFDSINIYTDGSYRYYGFTVRPVRPSE